MIAALYVEPNGCYANLAGVDAWPEARDARTYAGPWPVVAHPPCQRWGRFWKGGLAWKGEPKRLGDDDGCFAAALASVREWGGVLEHPAGSLAWRAHGLLHPPAAGGWVVADFNGGWTCQVDQGAYGHAARKPTWLYAVGVDLPSLCWGASSPEIEPWRSDAWKARAAKDGVCVLLSRRQRLATPHPFRDLLLRIAASGSHTMRPSETAQPSPRMDGADNRGSCAIPGVSSQQPHPSACQRGGGFLEN